MDTSQVALEVFNIIEDISHILPFYDLDSLFTEEEIKEAIGIISGLGQSFRHIHDEFSIILWDNYVAKYPKNDSTPDKLTDFIKSAKAKFRDKRNGIQARKNFNETESLKFYIELFNQK